MKNITSRQLQIISICVLIGIIVFIILTNYDPYLKAREAVDKRNRVILQKARDQVKTKQSAEYENQISVPKEVK